MEEVLPHLNLKNAQVLAGEVEKREWQASSSTDMAIFHETVNLTKLTGLEILELKGPQRPATWSDIFWELTRPVSYRMSPQACLKVNHLDHPLLIQFRVVSPEPYTHNQKYILSRLYL